MTESSIIYAFKSQGKRFRSCSCFGIGSCGCEGWRAGWPAIMDRRGPCASGSRASRAPPPARGTCPRTSCPPACRSPSGWSAALVWLLSANPNSISYICEGTYFPFFFQIRSMDTKNNIDTWILNNRHSSNFTICLPKSKIIIIRIRIKQLLWIQLASGEIHIYIMHFTISIWFFHISLSQWNKWNIIVRLTNFNMWGSGVLKECHVV